MEDDELEYSKFSKNAELDCCFFFFVCKYLENQLLKCTYNKVFLQKIDID